MVTTAVVLGTKTLLSDAEDSMTETVGLGVWAAVVAPTEAAVLVEKPCGRVTPFWAAQVSAGRPSGQQRPLMRQKESLGQGSVCQMSQLWCSFC